MSKQCAEGHIFNDSSEVCDRCGGPDVLATPVAAEEPAPTLEEAQAGVTPEALAEGAKMTDEEKAAAEASAETIPATEPEAPKTTPETSPEAAG